MKKKKIKTFKLQLGMNQDQTSDTEIKQPGPRNMLLVPQLVQVHNGRQMRKLILQSSAQWQSLSLASGQDTSVGKGLINLTPAIRMWSHYGY